MPFHLVSTNTTYTSGNHVWVVEGKREICITYVYYPETGHLWYAASIFRKPDANYIPTKKEIEDHETTCDRRWELRPAHVKIMSHLDMHGLIKQIRRQMCFGPGCKGLRPKKNKTIHDDDVSSETSSENSYLSLVIEHENYSGVLNADLPINTISRVYHERNQSREIFVVFTIKEDQIRYGASIKWFDTRSNDMSASINSNDDIKAHFDTAEDRFNKCPVLFTLEQKLYTAMVMYYEWLRGHGWTIETPRFIDNAIFNNINQRKKGQLQIRGNRIKQSVE